MEVAVTAASLAIRIRIQQTPPYAALTRELVYPRNPCRSANIPSTCSVCSDGYEKNCVRTYHM